MFHCKVECFISIYLLVENIKEYFYLLVFTGVPFPEPETECRDEDPMEEEVREEWRDMEAGDIGELGWEY